MTWARFALRTLLLLAGGLCLGWAAGGAPGGSPVGAGIRAVLLLSGVLLLIYGVGITGSS